MGRVFKSFDRKIKEIVEKPTLVDLKDFRIHAHQESCKGMGISECFKS